MRTAADHSTDQHPPTLSQLGSDLLCVTPLQLLTTPELAGGSALGRFLSGFLAIFWGGRIIIQLFFYDQQVKRSRPITNLVFLATFIYLCGVFAVACLRHNR